jgi:hypothetical protein
LLLFLSPMTKVLLLGTWIIFFASYDKGAFAVIFVSYGKGAFAGDLDYFFCVLWQRCICRPSTYLKRVILTPAVYPRSRW